MGKSVTDVGKNVTDVGHHEKERRQLKKHAATIHCSNTLSLLQRKVSNALLYHAYGELMQKEEHEITVKQLCRLIGYNGNNHAVIKEALKALISTVIEWNLINDETGQENWTASSIIASVSLEGPMCYYAYSPRMKQLLHSPSMFGKIDLVIQSKFRSSYGLALYENCIRYRGLPHTKWFDMELFKKLMGVPVGMYDVFRDFKRRVLDKAIDEVNTYSDLVIACELGKEGRRVVKVRFKLKERAKKTRLGNATSVPRLEAPQSELAAQLNQEFGLSTEQIEQVLAAYDSQFIQDKIGVIKASKPYQEGKVENLTGYLISALKNNYQPPKSMKTNSATSGTVINLVDARAEFEMSEIKRRIEGVREAYQLYREESIQQAIEALPARKRSVFMEAFMEFAEPAVHTILQLQRNKYSKENVMDSPQMQALLRRYALRQIDTINLVSLEEFVAQQDQSTIEIWHKLKSFDPEHPLLDRVE